MCKRRLKKKTFEVYQQVRFYTPSSITIDIYIYVYIYNSRTPIIQPVAQRYIKLLRIKFKVMFKVIYIYIYIWPYNAEVVQQCNEK
jgi:hypothetical protein